MEMTIPSFGLSEESMEKLQSAGRLIKLACDVYTRKIKLGDALSQLGITSDTLIDKIQAMLKNSENGFLNSLSETAFSEKLVGTTKDIATILHGYINGTFSMEECAEQLFTRVMPEINGAFAYFFSKVKMPDHVPAPLTKLLEITGITFGYEAYEYLVQEITTALKEQHDAKMERILIEQQCAEMLTELMDKRIEMQQFTERYFNNHYKTINAAFSAIDHAILHENIDEFISGNAVLQSVLGHTQQFQTMDEFDSLMESDEPFRL